MSPTFAPTATFSWAFSTACEYQTTAKSHQGGEREARTKTWETPHGSSEEKSDSGRKINVNTSCEHQTTAKSHQGGEGEARTKMWETPHGSSEEKSDSGRKINVNTSRGSFCRENSYLAQ